MVLWYYEKLWYYGKNYGTMNKTMVLYWELWNFDLRRKKTIGDYQKLRDLGFKWKKLGKYIKIIEVLNRFIALELWFTMEKLWYYGKYYGTMEKTMVLYLWNLIYYGKNYGTMEKTMVL